MIESRCGLLCSECSYREPNNCPGCVNAGKIFWGECGVKNCCESKEISSCGSCKELPCETLKEFSYDKEHGDNGARIEQCKKWLNEEVRDKMDHELVSKAAAIMKGAENAVIALIDENGFPRASAISNIKTEGIKYAWFSTGLCSGKAKCIRQNNKAGLCYYDGDNNVTTMGTIEILTEPEIKKELWVDWFINHFPGGVTDPNYCILKFTSEKAVFWIDCKQVELDLVEL